MPFRDFTSTETTTVTPVTHKKSSRYRWIDFREYDMEVAAGTTKTVAVDYKSF